MFHQPSRATRARAGLFLGTLLIASGAPVSSASGPGEATTTTTAKPQRLEPPSRGLVFEDHSTEAASRFVVRNRQLLALIEPQGVQLGLKRSRVSTTESPDAELQWSSEQLVGANPAARAHAGPVVHRVSYFRGPDPAHWRTGLPAHASVSFEDVYPGIDVVYLDSEGRLRRDYRIDPGADPSLIRVRFPIARSIALSPAGDLLIASAMGELRQTSPVAFQFDARGTVEPVDARFRLVAPNTVGFDVGHYDPTRELVIDPTLVYATYLAASSDDVAWEVAADSAGNAYVVGESLMPPTDGFPFAEPPGNVIGGLGNLDVFVTKFSPDGEVVYSAVLGGLGNDRGFTIAVSDDGLAHIGGGAGDGFPLLEPIQPWQGRTDGFLAVLSASGDQLLFSTYLGGDQDDQILDLAIDSSNRIHATGWTLSDENSFPATTDAFDSDFNGGFVDAFLAGVSWDDVASPQLDYSTFLGADGVDRAVGVALDGSGGVYVTGQTNSSTLFDGAPQPLVQPNRGSGNDAFLIRLDIAAQTASYFTWLGGTEDDGGIALQATASGEVIVIGNTTSSDYPVAAPLYTHRGGTDVFVSRVNADGSSLVYSTFFGGSAGDFAGDLVLTPDDQPILTGNSSSTDVPVTLGAVQVTNAGSGDAFVAQLETDGSMLLYSSWLGGNGDDFGDGIDLAGDLIFLVGETNGIGPNGFPVTANAAQPVGDVPPDGYFAIIDLAGEAPGVPHPADGNEDFAIATLELDDYGTAWRNADPWPVAPSPPEIDYVTNAGRLVDLGGDYVDQEGPAPGRWVPSQP